jgi:hypothetical protein
MSDFTIDNNGSIEDLKFNVRQFINAKTGMQKRAIWI